MESVRPESLTHALLCALAAHLVFAVVSVWLVAVDLREHRLPNRIVLWGTGLVFGLFVASTALAAAAPHADGPHTGGSPADAPLADEPWDRLLAAVVAGVLYGLVFFLLWFFAPHAVGAGDVKLAPLIGLVAGWSGLWIAALWVPLFIGAIGGIAGLVSRARRREFFAFGPVLIGACWLGVLFAGVGWIR